MNTRVVIVDDEAPARERLRRLLQELDGCDCAGEAADGHEAVTTCARLAPDVVLLDVRMPGLSGIEVAHHLASLPAPPAVIFTTAYDEYALEAFEAQAIGYLLKPVRREKLARALRHAARVTAPSLARAAVAARETRRQHVCARLGEQLRLIPVQDIYCFVADQKYVTVRHAGGEDLIDDSLKTLSDEFAPDFLRIHRNALVAERHVAAVERTGEGQYTVRLRGCPEPLQVSRRHAGELLRRLREGTVAPGPESEADEP
ncbi:MAG: LytR/AlgR family response regulator transcription factor [Alphaproteobacteria bacterium]